MRKFRLFLHKSAFFPRQITTLFKVILKYYKGGSGNFGISFAIINVFPTRDNHTFSVIIDYNKKRFLLE